VHTQPLQPGRAETAAYAAGAFSPGVFSSVPAVLLLYFCTEILGLPPAWATVIVFVPKAWSIAWDPFVGAWSDRTAMRLGRRRPFMIVGALGVALSFVMVFSPPALGLGGTGLWVGCAYFLLASFYSLFAVPYSAIPAEVGGPPEGRARLVSWRMVVAMVGLLAGAGAVPLLVEASGGGRAGYANTSLFLAGVCAIAMAGPVLMMRGRDRPALHGGGARRPRLWQNLWVATSNRSFVWLAVSYVIQLTAVGVVASTAPYLVTRAFGRGEGDIGTAMLAMFSVTALAIPAWSWAGRRFGNDRMLIVAILGFAALSSCIGMLAWGQAPWAAALVLFGLLGVPFSAIQVLPFTIVAHLVHGATRTGVAAEGSFTGVWTATEKLGLALGPGLTGLVLALTHGDITTTLALFTAIGPALLALLSLPFLVESRRCATMRPLEVCA